jgi:hypothetical protein
LKASPFTGISWKIRKNILFLFFLIYFFSPFKAGASAFSFGFVEEDLLIAPIIADDSFQLSFLNEDNDSEVFFDLTQSILLIKIEFILISSKNFSFFSSYNLHLFFTDLPPPLSI